MSNETARVGSKFDLKLEDLVTPWIYSTVWVQFDNGQKVAAKIMGVGSGIAQMVVVETDTKQPL